MNTYMSSQVPPTPTPSSSSRSCTSKVPSQVLSLNLQFLIYHGEMPDADED
ncbi:hypothetical protein BYT27DRAFT_7252909 [Phlegmacium glaucopus]|nr:hypothetical protein BYT27DRAFT_7252909 [Phlegmacium glaucopus]